MVGMLGTLMMMMMITTLLLILGVGETVAGTATAPTRATRSQKKPEKENQPKKSACDSTS